MCKNKKAITKITIIISHFKYFNLENLKARKFVNFFLISVHLFDISFIIRIQGVLEISVKIVFGNRPGFFVIGYGRIVLYFKIQGAKEDFFKIKFLPYCFGCTEIWYSF